MNANTPTPWTLWALTLLASGCFEATPYVGVDGSGSSGETSDSNDSNDATTSGTPVPEDEADTGGTTASHVDDGTTSGGESTSASDSDDPTDVGSSGVPSDGSSGTGEGDTKGINDPPIARDDGPYVIEADQILHVDALTGLLSNDEDPEGGPIEVTIGGGMTALGGMLSISPDGSFDYLPPADMPFGTDRFDYTIKDDRDQLAAAELRVVVQPPQGQIDLGQLGTKGVRLEGIDSSDNSGYSVSSAGDVNGDGFADILVGAQQADPVGTGQGGETYLVYGQPSLASPFDLSLADVRFDGISSNDNSGRSVRSAGDVNGDGFSDILIAAHRGDAGGSESGETYLIYGGEFLPATVALADADVRFDGLDYTDYSGFALGTAGDVNGDGFSDILIGAYLSDPNGQSNAGETYLVYGGDSLLPNIDLVSADVRFDGIASNDQSGHTLGGGGDVNGDGYADILIAAPSHNASSGETYLIYGGTTLDAVIDLNSADVILTGIVSSDRSGYSVSSAGDFDGDGYADLLIGAVYADPTAGSDAGESYLVFGGPALPPIVELANADVRFEGLASNDRLGHAVSYAGDVNADGYSDILIAAPQADPGGAMDAGESYLVLGGPTIAPLFDLADAELTFSGIDESDQSGQSVAFAGDVDGDGFDDLLIGSHYADPGGDSAAGETYLVYGDDLMAGVTQIGTEGPDTLGATRGLQADVIVAGRGNDLVVSDGGPDVIHGGEGNDTLVLTSTDIRQLDGGLGNDTLELEAGLALDLTTFVTPPFVSIEHIQLSLVGPTSIRASALDVVNLSDNDNALVIDGDADDEVALVGDVWFGPVPEGGYDRYHSTSTEAEVLVSNAITVTDP